MVEFKITILSTMLVGEPRGIGEWGFSALVEIDGPRVLVDTGERPGTVLQNSLELGLDLSDVEEVILTHSHWDHVTGLLTLRRELMKANPQALSVAIVPEGIFSSRPSPSGESNPMVTIRGEYEATGGRFVVHPSGAEISPSLWFTGPIPRIYDEHNWSGSGKVRTPSGLTEDNVPEDSSLVLDTPKGLVVLTGCAHAGIVNILTFVASHYDRKPIYGIVGGIHLFDADDQVVSWTASKLREHEVAISWRRIARGSKQPINCATSWG